MTIGTGRQLVGLYLRDCANYHYFASIRPYLDRLLEQPDIDSRLIVRRPAASYDAFPEYGGYAQLFTADLRVDDCDLVLTPTFLRPEDRPEPRNPRTRIVQIFHGMSDKPFTYERDFRDYALCLCAGQRQVNRLRAHHHNRQIYCVQVGYPKFDAIPRLAPLFGDDRKTLIYCPTWRKGGISSIDVFLDHPEVVAELTERYNLIVKPHPNIFNPSRPCFDPSIVARIEQLPRIELARSGTVMPRQAQADLFIGDISAAGYEWLYFGRPMVFLNPQPGRLRPSRDAQAMTYLWQCGDVCDDIRRLPALVAEALAKDRLNGVREAVLHYSVYRPRDRHATNRGMAELEPLLDAKEVRGG
jgi:CDP-Glycerol:Poly(glycerophosphate) glycerophosphotransferase